MKSFTEFTEFPKRHCEWLRFSYSLAFCVEGVSREPETYGACVVFLSLAKKLRQPRVLAQQQRQNAGSHWVKRAQMSHRAFTRRAAHNRNNIMRRNT